ncbi:hypothetical protein SKAU_G00314370 [Synaphobranchus kaupii]|uniref:Uncharacterized protein n=1 Tax=Synaphobranchus kaupii TaxID=118154 RepID=A0A9Q1ES96_SYNKA|nr:hypothetical protein SKAU_G00314370 [Synaphobranchus kaupii]
MVHLIVYVRVCESILLKALAGFANAGRYLAQMYPTVRRREGGEEPPWGGKVAIDCAGPRGNGAGNAGPR